MKSYNHLWEQYLTAENYQLAVHNAALHKGGKRRKYRKARYFRDNMEALQSTMLYYAEHFRSKNHRKVKIYDGIRRKQRFIVVPDMKEQIVHHMVINVLKPIFLKGMYEHSYGSIPGRGAHAAKKTIEKWIKRSGKKAKYCMKMDIKKYFDSIPHDILKAKLANLIHDERFLNVLNRIVDAGNGDKGIPIGFYTSQWIANWYLTGLDHYIKEKLHADFYIRYMDDMVIFGSNKRVLHKMRKAIVAYLHDNLGLELKDNWQIFLFDYIKKNGKRVGRDLDFMGFRFFRDKTILRKTLLVKMTRKARRVCRKPMKTVHDCRQMLSYLGWIDCTNTYGMYKKWIKPFVNFQYLKRRVSANQRNINLEKENNLCHGIKTAMVNP